jgi:acetolactate synthase small subunit
MLHTFVAYVEDLPGVLTRVASLFRRLNININSLTVGRSERAGLSRLTLVCEASAEAGHRIRASLYKLENVVDVDDIAQAPSVTRELALIKVAATPATVRRSSSWSRSFAPHRRPGAGVADDRDDRRGKQDRRAHPGAQRRREPHSRNLPQRQDDHAPRPPHQRRAQGHGRRGG